MFALPKTVVALLAAGSLALTGCAGESKPDAKADVLTLLRTEAATSLQTSLEKSEKAQSASFAVEGKSDGEALKGQGAVFYGDSPKGTLTFEDAEDGPTEMRFLPTAMYISVAEKERAEMDGKEWLKLDVAAAAKLANDEDAADMLVEYARQLRDLNPSAQVKTLMAGGKSTVVGEETIDGVKTVHYTGTKPLSDYLAEVDAKSRAAVEAKLTKAGVKDVKVDVWVDEQYQPRRTRTVVGTMDDLTVTFSDYGKKVEVTEPPADTTLDFVQMLQELAKLGADLGG
jgi:hypothetical protein